MKIVLLLALVIVMITSISAFFAYNKIQSIATDIHQPIEREYSVKRTKKVELEEKDPISILLMGVDERPEEGDKGRADTLIVVTVNPVSNDVKMMSIPRDTYVNIPGYGLDKINHSYAFGDVELAIQTVEGFLDIPIDYFLKVNMESFIQLIDETGGITVQNGTSFTSNGIFFGQGEITLRNGNEALSYIQMRYEDPRGDFGRQERQRIVVAAAVRKVAETRNPGELLNIVSVLSDSVKTNLSIEEVTELYNYYRKSANQIEMSSLDGGQGQYINEIYYYVVPENSINEKSDILRSHLNTE
ncbi:LCP family protein [Jeotgalibacillus sp. R-1-5s-1]|uniref:LCP family glycopolymer transferase n=1 Tax=Jeotgalibacillus sp. R-1-5s-1 TaxID=2555897 RepID=UPI00141B98AD|nr:LCP family protein [Jeotgalibacillus sp. R-1-5s-1]